MEDIKADFVTCCNNIPEDVNYTQWRQSQPWLNTPLDEAIDNAINFVKNNPDVIPKNATLI
jgi:hypothetical protein